MTGKPFAAWAIAQATTWVKETFMPRSLRTLFSALRLASSVSTAIVRNEVAVGTSRLSSIALASIAAGPRSTFTSPACGRSGAVPAPVGRRDHILFRDLRPWPAPGDSRQVNPELMPRRDEPPEWPGRLGNRR